MTVKELIDHLMTLDPDLEVIVYLNGKVVKVRKDRVCTVRTLADLEKTEWVIIGGY